MTNKNERHFLKGKIISLKVHLLLLSTCETFNDRQMFTFVRRLSKSLNRSSGWSNHPKKEITSSTHIYLKSAKKHRNPRLKRICVSQEKETFCVLYLEQKKYYRLSLICLQEISDPQTNKQKSEWMFSPFRCSVFLPPLNGYLINHLHSVNKQ